MNHRLLRRIRTSIRQICQVSHLIWTLIPNQYNWSVRGSWIRMILITLCWSHIVWQHRDLVVLAAQVVRTHVGGMMWKFKSMKPKRTLWPFLKSLKHLWIHNSWMHISFYCCRSFILPDVSSILSWCIQKIFKLFGYYHFVCSDIFSKNHIVFWATEKSNWSIQHWWIQSCGLWCICLHFHDMVYQLAILMIHSVYSN